MSEMGASRPGPDDDDARAARYRDLFAGDHEHPSDCSMCPICSTIAVLRQTKPEVVEHLAKAARELVAAAAILVSEAERVVGSPEEAAQSGSGGPTLRRIDVV